MFTSRFMLFVSMSPGFSDLARNQSPPEVFMIHLDYHGPYFDQIKFGSNHCGPHEICYVNK